ncbi:MAG TPA: EVE domain-containing protein [Polyangiaceae bacterium]|nr:EVE domain-containing protein [Polyangiaceae bacterium]
MAKAHFLIKSEPYKYPFSQLVTDGRTTWDGVRNFEARNHLRAMKVGDLLLYYHSNEGKEIVGVARVVRTAYPDPTAKEGDWSVVDIVPVKPLVEPVSLARIKEDRVLSQMALVKRSRLSVVPVSAPEFRRVLELGRTKL